VWHHPCVNYNESLTRINTLYVLCGSGRIKLLVVEVKENVLDEGDTSAWLCFAKQHVRKATVFAAARTSNLFVRPLTLVGKTKAIILDPNTGL